MWPGRIGEDKFADMQQVANHPRNAAYLTVEKGRLMVDQEESAGISTLNCSGSVTRKLCLYLRRHYSLLWCRHINNGPGLTRECGHNIGRATHEPFERYRAAGTQARPASLRIEQLRRTQMGTKNNPGEFDCYENAEPDEPMFILLGRDKHAPTLVWLWATLRELAGEQASKVSEARACAADMMKWAQDHEVRK